jgi:rubrerythrin
MTLAPHVLHLVRTACLVESRAHQYSGYLASVFAHRGWTTTFDQWGGEEETHGTRLRAWLEKEDPTFDFERSMGRYLATVPYHAEEGGSVYGSEQGELVARCFVEAMAATYYQAVGGGAVGCVSLQALCRGLAADEARHYTMFRRLLERIRREEGIRRVEAVRVVMQRMLALQDEQIVFASFIAGGGVGAFELEEEGRRYRAMMLALYRPEHVRFVGTLVAQVLEVPRPPKWVDYFVDGALRLAPLPDPLP